MKSNTRSLSATSVSEDGRDITVEMFEDLSVNIYLDNERVGSGDFVEGAVEACATLTEDSDWDLVDEIARDLAVELEGGAEPEPTPEGSRLASEASAALGCYVATLEAQIAEIKALGDAIAETASRVREAALEVRAVRMGLVD